MNAELGCDIGSGRTDTPSIDQLRHFVQQLAPQVFLPRMAPLVDAISADKWRFDRDVLRCKLPE
jgi:hypothetical protein